MYRRIVLACCLFGIWSACAREVPDAPYTGVWHGVRFQFAMHVQDAFATRFNARRQQILQEIGRDPTGIPFATWSVARLTVNNGSSVPLHRPERPPWVELIGDDRSAYGGIPMPTAIRRLAEITERFGRSVELPAPTPAQAVEHVFLQERYRLTLLPEDSILYRCWADAWQRLYGLQLQSVPPFSIYRLEVVNGSDVSMPADFRLSVRADARTWTDVPSLRSALEQVQHMIDAAMAHVREDEPMRERAFQQVGNAFTLCVLQGVQDDRSWLPPGGRTVMEFVLMGVDARDVRRVRLRGGRIGGYWQALLRDLPAACTFPIAPGRTCAWYFLMPSDRPERVRAVRVFWQDRWIILE